MLRELSESQKATIVELLRSQGASVGGFGFLANSTDEEIRLALGTASMSGRDPKRF